jgi:methylmalonyl-CoA/ethylmalonyl-CoA epimerase
MIDDAPRRGARGHKVAFVHPRATGGVLVELVEPDAGEEPERM